MRRNLNNPDDMVVKVLRWLGMSYYISFVVLPVVITLNSKEIRTALKRLRSKVVRNGTVIESSSVVRPSVVRPSVRRPSV